ncbi:MAG TPA: hypothetical protein VF846_07845 [Thermoanaerobaculia bacterium]|jgi:hypothetical protein
MPAITRIVDAAKRRFHRDTVSHPVMHAWVLNLYRAGERYPQTVTDYFPSRHAPSAELAALLDRHRHDEERHTAMYAAAIRTLEQPVVELEGADVFNVAIRSHTGESFTIDEDDATDTRRLKLAHFLTHAHFLEKRIERSLQYHRDACELGGALVAERVVTAVLQDETRHVRYTAEHARALLTSREAATVFEHHRNAEARANLDFSQRQVRTCSRMFGTLVRADQRWFYDGCAFLMQQAVAFV